MILLLATVVTAATAAAPAAPPVDPAALTAATALVQQLDVRGKVLATMNRNIAAMRSGVALRAMLAQQPGFIQAYQANKAKFDPALQKAGTIQAGIAEKVLAENLNAVVAQAARVYARNYTAAELKGLSDFYKTPLGQSFYKHDGQVRGEIDAVGGQLLASKMQAGMQAAAPRIEAALAPLKSGPPPAAPAK